jgi:hypothetical protein
MDRRKLALAIAAVAVVLVGGAALASGLGDNGTPATDVTAAPAPGSQTTSGTTALATVTAIDPSLPVGDPRRLPLPAPGELAGVLLTGSGICEPGIVDLARPGPPGRIALSAPACAVRTSPSGRFLATSTQFEPEGQPIVVLDTATGATRTGRRVGSGVGRGPTVVSDRGAIATCEFSGTVIDTARRTLRVKGSGCGRIAIGNRILALRPDRRTLVDATTGTRVLRLSEPVRGELPVLATSRTGLLIAGFAFDQAAAFTFLTIYDRRGRVVRPRRRLTNAFRVRDMQLADDGRALALRSDAGWELFNLETGDRVRQVGRSPITSAAIAPDGDRFAVATPRAIVFIDVGTLAPRLAIPAQVRGVLWLDRAPGATP